MKIQTNIKHKRPHQDVYCPETLCKEFWGNIKYNPEWNMTCMTCGFSRMIDNETFLKWQYCDEVVE